MGSLVHCQRVNHHHISIHEMTMLSTDIIGSVVCVSMVKSPRQTVLWEKATHTVECFGSCEGATQETLLQGV